MNRDLLLRRMAENVHGSIAHIAEQLPWAIVECDKAMKALAKRGHVECYGLGRNRRPDGGGMPPKLWRITPAGIEAAKRRFWWVSMWPAEVLA